MTFSPKTWKDYPDRSTPLDAAGLNDLESRVEAFSLLAESRIRTLDPPVGTPATDRATIQAALNAGPGVVRLSPGGHDYEVDSAGSQTFTSAGGTVAYCIEIPANVVLDLNGSNLVLAPGTNAILLCNAAPGATTDSKIGVVGKGKLIGTGNTLTNKGLARFEGVTGLNFDVEIEDSDEVGIYVLNCTRAGGNIEADSVTGIGIYLGSPTYPNFDCSFGTLIARNVDPNVANALNFPGNSVYANLQGVSTILSITAKNCDAGVKIDKCVDLDIGIVNGDTCGDAGGNSGLKFQSGTVGFPTRVTVGQVHMKAQQAQGLYFDANSVDCSVGTYVGEGNAILASAPDVWLDGTRPVIGTMRSTASAASSLTIRSTATDYRIGICVIRNPVNTGDVVSDAGGKGAIGQLLCLDDQGVPKMTRGYRSNSANTVIHIGDFDCRGHTFAPLQRTTGDKVSIGNHRGVASTDLRSQTLATDAAFTLTVGTSPVQTFHTGTLTADRAVTLSTTNVYPGARFRITRTGGGAFNLTNALKNLATNQWAEFEYDGVNAAWKLAAFGSL